ncbi:protein of unknown function [Candidatus Promineifilum breve]|uniref:Uncharacterized protein n=1 Tax=Candidatus Promineifilum breve TaxID=1806508 RepID=A0A160SZU6_9CHLR|nr:protein of unknown function [Candidatus Promineifilum breve]
MHVAQGDRYQTGGDALAGHLDGVGVGAAAVGVGFDADGHLQGLGRVLQRPEQAGVDVGADAQHRPAAQFGQFAIARARSLGVGDVDSHGRVGPPGVGAGVGSQEGLLFLRRRHGDDVPGVAALLQLLQADGHRRHRGAVIERLAGGAIVEQLAQRLAKGDEIADRHQLAHLLDGQAQVENQGVPAIRLAALFLRQQVIGQAAQHAGQLTLTVDDGRLAQQVAAIDPAQLGDAQEAVAVVLDDARDHEAQFVLVGGQQDGGARGAGLARAALDAQQAAHAVGDDLIDQRPPDFGDGGGDAPLVARGAGGFGELFQASECIHRRPLFGNQVQGVGVRVGVPVRSSSVTSRVGVTVSVGVSVGVMVSVAVSVGVGVAVAVSVGVGVAVAVLVGVAVVVAVVVAVAVAVSVGVGVTDAVTVASGVGEPGGVSETTAGGGRVGSSVGVGEAVTASVGVGVAPPRLGARAKRTMPDK